MENTTPEKKKIVFSAIQPSGSLTLGNYLGASKLDDKFKSELDRKKTKFAYTQYSYEGAVQLNYTLMEKQLDFARKLLADRTISGLIFHPTFVANLDLEAVKLSKSWIKAYADDPWGV